MVPEAVESRPKYWTPAEVAVHNVEEDLWVSFLGHVYDLTTLAKQYKGDPLLRPIIVHAGQDISHWFDETTGQVRMHIDPVTGCSLPYTPQGRFIHIPPSVPLTNYDTDIGTPWWDDKETYCIGKLTVKTRMLRVVNMLSSQETMIEVCTEETISEIQDRYIKHNSHAASYTWKQEGRLLDMDKTLADNEIPDETELFYKLSIDSTNEMAISEVQVYYNDDLTEG